MLFISVCMLGRCLCVFVSVYWEGVCMLGRCLCVFVCVFMGGCV